MEIYQSKSKTHLSFVVLKIRGRNWNSLENKAGILRLTPLYHRLDPIYSL